MSYKVKISEKARDMYGAPPYPRTLLCWQWCIDNLGKPEPYGSKWSWDTIRTFKFNDALDATIFKLKWS